MQVIQNVEYGVQEVSLFVSPIAATLLPFLKTARYYLLQTTHKCVHPSFVCTDVVDYFSLYSKTV